MKFLGTINNYKADPSGRIGSVIMFIFALFAGYRWYATGFIFFALLMIRDLTASWFLISRKANVGKVEYKLIEIVAYFSSACPFLYLTSTRISSSAGFISTVLAILGFTISTLALLDLGASFGVTPANRGVVKNGLYNYVRHPMYLGYAISEFGFILINPLNVFIYFLSMSLYFIRTRFENKILKD